MPSASNPLVGLTLRGKAVDHAGPMQAAAASRPRAARPAGRRDVLLDVLRPRVEARGLPFEFVIEVTSRCNLVCPMCPREISPDVGNKDMQIETFQRVFERIKETARFVWFAGLGEPMMSKHLMRMIAAVRAAGIATGMSTNGTFLTKKLRERLLDSGLDLMIASFDGADKSTYEQIRVGADFDKVCENIRAFAALKARRRAPWPWLILQMIELSPTRHQAKEFRRMWAIPGVDAVRIKKDELQFVESLGFEGQRKRQTDRPCPYLWRGTMYIHWDGAVSPCCYGSHDKTFGNLLDSSVEELWNSARVRSVRSAHLSGSGVNEPFCKNCNTFQPGKIPMAASVLVPSLTQKKYAGVVEAVNRFLPVME